MRNGTAQRASGATTPGLRNPSRSTDRSSKRDSPSHRFGRQGCCPLQLRRPTRGSVGRIFRSFSMAGSWLPLANQPQFTASTMLLLTNGRVMCQEENRKIWWGLTPDASIRGAKVFAVCAALQVCAGIRPDFSSEQRHFTDTSHRSEAASQPGTWCLWSCWWSLPAARLCNRCGWSLPEARSWKIQW